MNDSKNAGYKQSQTGQETDQRFPVNSAKDPSPTQPATGQQLHQTEQTIEERLSAFERSMLRLTRAAVVISLVTGLVFAGQLYEMWQAGQQTDKLLSAAKALADAASDTADAARDQVDAANNFADTAEDINKGIANAAIQLQASAENSKRWTNTVQGSMRLDQRAWISATVVGQTIQTSAPISATLRVQNIGRTPATKISGLIKLEPIDNGKVPEFVYKQKIVEGQPAVGDFALGTLLPNGQANLRIPHVIGLAQKGTVGELVLDPERA
ncbi:MAG TPA: hypothetical protein VIH91_04375 [Terriglobales bacterium]